MYSSNSRKSLPVRKQIQNRSSISIPNNKLPRQDQLDNLEIRFTKCTFTYKLKHIETQANKSRRRKVGKSLGYSFRSLRTTYSEKQEELLFTDCIFNPSDIGIVKEHIKNLETPRIRFINCKFIRRDSLLSEKADRFWRRLLNGMVIKFSGHGGNVDVHNDVIKLKELSSAIEFVIENVDFK